MRKLLIILVMFTSCTETGLEELIENTDTPINYTEVIKGKWIDIDQQEDLLFNSTELFFISPQETLGGFEYWLEGDQLTYKAGSYLEITKTVKISNDSLYYADKIYLRD